jgi:hypothetical protein
MQVDKSERSPEHERDDINLTIANLTPFQSLIGNNDSLFDSHLLKKDLKPGLDFHLLRLVEFNFDGKYFPSRVKNKVNLIAVGAAPKEQVGQAVQAVLIKLQQLQIDKIFRNRALFFFELSFIAR